MNKKNGRPQKVIAPYHGNGGPYIIYALNSNGKYVRNGAPKIARDILPFIDNGTYKGITSEAKDLLLDHRLNGKTKRLIEDLVLVEVKL